MRLAERLRMITGVSVLVLLAGCGVLDKKLVEGGIPRGGSLIPDAAVRISPEYTTSLSSLANTAAAAIVLNYVYQPLDPNWDLADIPLSHDTHRFALRMKRFSTGGEGEAWQIARRYAEGLQVAKGASGYVVLEFTQGIDSSTP
ncbi:MAG TPA: hypothetical protein VFH22_05470, partial [Rhodocyclaceae bacterium]|nr:hypothetical protein [Rhodocyclaceae bacterium]